MSVLKFPSKLPGPNGLDLAKAELTQLLQNNAGLLLAHANKLLEAINPSEAAECIREIASDAKDSANGWGEISSKIKSTWGI